MISHISGRISAITPQSAVIDVGGVGLSVMCSPSTLAQLVQGQDGYLATSLIVREDSLTLYGFLSEEERSIFELVQTASGVGPRLAQAICAVHAPDELRRAIATGDVAALTAVPGVGKKGAQRLILELKDRIGPIAASSDSDIQSSSSVSSHVTEGLVALGWSPAHAEKAARQAISMLSENGDLPATPVVLKHAIGLLGSSR